MTLAICLRGSNGLVLISDSRMSGITSKDDSNKFLQVNRDIGIMTYGLAEPGNQGIRNLRDQVNQLQLAHFSQIAGVAKNVFLNEYNSYKTKITDQGLQFDDSQNSLGFILAGFDSHESTQFKIYLYESPHFDLQERTDVVAAQWHISQLIYEYLYYPQMTVQQLKQLAVIFMLQTSSYNVAVGGPIQLATVTYTRGFKQIDSDEINGIIELVQPKIIEFRRILMTTFTDLLAPSV